MKYNHLAILGLSATMAFSPISRAQADGGDIAGGILGGIIGGVIVNEANKNRAPRKVYRRSTVSSATRAENREIQTSLNYFGFPAGSPDGVLGRRSRSAISQYQAHLGYPPTGQLSLYEKDFLISSYHRAIAGGAATHQQIATHPMGARGLLLNYRDQNVPGGYGYTAPPVTVVQPQPQPQAVEPAAPMTVEVATPVPEAAPDAAPGLPTFLGQGGGQSLASHCNTVSLLTNTNGGFTTLASMTDPDTALNEQFCLARTYAIAEGEELISGIQGVGTDEIARQCEGFGPAMKDHVAALSLKGRDEVLAGVSQFALSTGMSPQQLAATAKICLSVGYRTDNMDVALGSALLLTALGEQVYGELMGHHLSQGVGATARADLAASWYDLGLGALERGQPAVFAPGQPERTALIRAASAAIAGGKAGTMTAPIQPVTTLPSFTLEN